MSEPAARAVPRVKICGLTSLHDAELATELGAWALGMIFYEHSPRRCSPTQAAQIVTALRRKVELCGVFVNAPLQQVVALSEDLGLTLLQFNGDEGPSFCAEAARRTGTRVIKAAQVSGPGDVRALERFHVDFHLLDTRAKDPRRRELRGGTGETFDWELVRARRSRVPLILSGGLDAGNGGGGIAAGPPDARGPRPTRRPRRGRSRVSAGAAQQPPVEHHFGIYGGQFVPETLMPALAELE